MYFPSIWSVCVSHALMRLCNDMSQAGKGEKTHGASGGAVKGLLALDVDIGAVGCLELDLKVGYTCVSCASREALELNMPAWVW